MTLPDDVPWDPAVLRIPKNLVSSSGRIALEWSVVNRRTDAVITVRLQSASPWIEIPVGELALGPGERQPLRVVVVAEGARRQLTEGGEPSGEIRIAWQYRVGESAEPVVTGVLPVRLPVFHCPQCAKRLDPEAGGDGAGFPPVCPWCYERLRECPVCGEPNTAAARFCVADVSHVVRDDPEWFSPGGDPSHGGFRPVRVDGCARLWSFPSMVPAPGKRWAWSAPAAAFGLVAVAATDPEGRSWLHAFDIATGARPWDPVELPEPVYPGKGGLAISGGMVYLATVDGTAMAFDLLRGTRQWEIRLGGKVFSSPIAIAAGPVAWAMDCGGIGALVQVAPDDGKVLTSTPLPSASGLAPASDGSIVVAHDNSGTVTAVRVGTEAVLWQTRQGTGFDAAPWVQGEHVVSGDTEGDVVCRRLSDGAVQWECKAVGAAVSGTPAGDGTIVVVPAANGAHRIATATGRLVRHHFLRRPVRASPLLTTSHLLLADTEGRLHACSAGKADEVLYEAGVPGAQWIADPALTDGILVLAGSHGVLVALRIADRDTRGHGV